MEDSNVWGFGAPWTPLHMKGGVSIKKKHFSRFAPRFPQGDGNQWDYSSTTGRDAVVNQTLS